MAHELSLTGSMAASAVGGNCGRAWLDREPASWSVDGSRRWKQRGFWVIGFRFRVVERETRREMGNLSLNEGVPAQGLGQIVGLPTWVFG